MLVRCSINGRHILRLRVDVKEIKHCEWKKKGFHCFFLCAQCVCSSMMPMKPWLESVIGKMLLDWAGSRSTFIAVGGLVMLSTRRSMNEHRVRAWPRCISHLHGFVSFVQRFSEVSQVYVDIYHD